MPTPTLTVYKSSAGSGKTYTLVKEYIKLCINPKSSHTFRNILAITFTNKATAEMKERVVKTLKAIARNEDPEKYKPLIRDLEQELHIPAHEIAFRCADVISRLLHNYSDFTILTIDKFTYKIIKAFAFDLNLPLHFDVSLEDEDMIELAVDELLQTSTQNPWLKKILVQFIEHNTASERGWDIEQTLRDFAKKMMSEEAFFHLREARELSWEDFQVMQKSLDAWKQIMLDALQTLQTKYEHLLLQHHIDYKWFKAHTIPGQLKKIERLIQDPFGIDYKKDFLPTNTLLESAETGIWYAKSLPKSHQTIMNDCAGDWVAWTRELEDVLEQHQHYFMMAKLLQKTLFPTILLQAIKKKQDEMIKSSHQVHISEFNKKIADILKSDPVAYIYERLGAKYVHFLMDEFQDTSKLQWNNIIPLLEESIAHGHANFIVGDAKQAIYRWRGGEVSQFVNLPDQPFLERMYSKKTTSEAELRPLFPVRFLDYNYRSHDTVVAFNNQLFEAIKGILSPEHQNIYQNHAQNTLNTKPGGRVEFAAFEIKKTSSDEEDEPSPLFEQVLAKIETSIKQGYSYGDICVLSRNNRELRLYSEFLMSKNIPIVSSESLLLSASPHVAFVIAFLDWESKKTPQKTIELLYLMRKMNLVQEEDFPKFIHHPETLNHYLTQDLGFQETHFQALGVYEKLEYLIVLLNINKHEDAFIHGLLDLAHGFSIQKENSERAFLEYWETQKEKKSLQLSGSSNAVQLMTIHKSKGLEFPVLILTDANWNLAGKSTQYFWVKPEEPELEKLSYMLLPDQKELIYTRYGHLHEAEKQRILMDNINLLYVALTRASECLYVFSSYNAKKQALHNHLVKALQTIDPSYTVDQVWEQGTIPTQMPKPELSQKAEPETHYQYHQAWRNQLSVSFEYEKYGYAQKTHEGNLLHDMLAEIYHEADIVPQVRNFVLKGLIQAENALFYTQMLQKIVGHPELQSFFNKNLTIYNERDIFINPGTRIRPDKLVLFEQKAVVLDYKTGLALPEHEHQIAEYCSHVSHIKGLPTEGLLVYTGQDELKIVPVMNIIV
jgi:ATP-dependent exoDNAse (exonuclease V) beta subunit